MAEANEAPLDAARREVAEELGVAYGGGRPLVVDWLVPHGPWDDNLAFNFDGGVMLARLSHCANTGRKLTNLRREGRTGAAD